MLGHRLRHQLRLIPETHQHSNALESRKINSSPERNIPSKRAATSPISNSEGAAVTSSFQRSPTSILVKRDNTAAEFGGLSKHECLAAFQHWVRNIRVHCQDVEERLICPMLWCRDRFGDQSSALKHLSACPWLEDAWYWCPFCRGPERFQSSRKTTLQNKIQWKDLRLKTLSFFTHFGRKNSGKGQTSLSPRPPKDENSESFPRVSMSCNPELEINQRYEAEGSGLRQLQHEHQAPLVGWVNDKTRDPIGMGEVNASDALIPGLGLQRQVFHEMYDPSSRQVVELPTHYESWFRTELPAYNISVAYPQPSVDLSIVASRPSQTIEPYAYNETGKGIGPHFHTSHAQVLDQHDECGEASPTATDVSPISKLVSLGSSVSPTSEAQSFLAIHNTNSFGASSDILGPPLSAPRPSWPRQQQPKNHHHLSSALIQPKVQSANHQEHLGNAEERFSSGYPPRGPSVSDNITIKATISILQDAGGLCDGVLTPTQIPVRRVLALVYFVHNEWRERLSLTPELLSRHSLVSAYTTFKTGVGVLKQFFCGRLPSSFDDIFALMHVACACMLYNEDGTYQVDKFFQDMRRWQNAISDKSHVYFFLRVVDQLSRPQGSPTTSPRGSELLDMPFCTALPTQWPYVYNTGVPLTETSPTLRMLGCEPLQPPLMSPNENRVLDHLQQGKVIKECSIFLDGKPSSEVTIVI